MIKIPKKTKAAITVSIILMTSYVISTLAMIKDLVRDNYMMGRSGFSETFIADASLKFYLTTGSIFAVTIFFLWLLFQGNKFGWYGSFMSLSLFVPLISTVLQEVFRNAVYFDYIGGMASVSLSLWAVFFELLILLPILMIFRDRKNYFAAVEAFKKMGK